MYRRNTILTALFILIFSAAAEAQLIGTNPTFTASIYGNATFVDFSSDNPANDVVEYDSKLGYGVNFGYSENINEDLKLSFQAGLLKAAWSADDDFSGGTFEFDALYLTLQPTLQQSFNGILLRGGFFYDIGLTGTNTLPSGNEFKIFEDEALNRTNAGLIIGTGLDVTEATRNFVDKLWGTNDNFFFEIIVDYRWGLADVEGASDADNQKATLSFLTFGLRSNF